MLQEKNQQGHGTVMGLRIKQVHFKCFSGTFIFSVTVTVKL